MIDATRNAQIHRYYSGLSATPGATEKPASNGALDDDRTTLSGHAQRLLAARGLSTQEIATFDAIVSRAAEQGDEQDPVEFLAGLSVEQRRVLQKAHSLSETVVPSQLSREGATNLLRYPGDGLDLDQDGLVSSGKGRHFQFPPGEAPAGVKEAWAAATAGMSDLERVSAEGMFHVLTLRVDDAGQVIPNEPGNPGPFSGAGFSFAQMVMQRLESLEVTRKFAQVSDEQYNRDRAFLERFADALAERGVG